MIPSGIESRHSYTFKDVTYTVVVIKHISVIHLNIALPFQVINKLSSRRKTNLPTSVQQNYSKTCSVQ